MSYYRGLSGLDTALFAFVVMHLIGIMKRNEDRTGRILALIVLAGLGLKITFEAITGEAVFVRNMATDLIVVPLAHIIGVGIGLLAAYLKSLTNISAVPTATFNPRM
jgi:hypothetical protein